MNFKALGLAGIAFTLSAIPALAHHSFAMFDAEKKMTLDGTVKEFQWTNPHSWILLTVSDAQGKAEQWAIEMGGPSGLARQGWVPKTLTPGMKVQAVIHPLRDGTPAGSSWRSRCRTAPSSEIPMRAPAPTQAQLLELSDRVTTAASTMQL
jgi:hypothetical protein